MPGVSNFFQLALERVPVVTFSTASATPDKNGRSFLRTILSFILFEPRSIEPKIEEPLNLFNCLSSQDALKARTSFDDLVDMLYFIKSQQISSHPKALDLLEEAIQDLFMVAINQVWSEHPTRNDVLKQFFSLLNVTFFQEKTSCKKVQEMGLDTFLQKKIVEMTGLGADEVSSVYQQLCISSSNPEDGNNYSFEEKTSSLLFGF